MNHSQNLLLELLRSLEQDNIIYFPIRHHSPACAWHIQRLIQTEKPEAVLIEGPSDITELIPFILHSQSQSPFAIYTTYIEAQQKLEELSIPPRRFAGYYPFCDYSPEYVALQAGAKIAAHLQFIDLTFTAQTLNSQNTEQIRDLQQESYLQRSEYLAKLAQKTGCRNHDELWDHLFEANFLTLPTIEFMRHVATYCFMARQDSPPQLLEAEGTIARETAMAAAIQDVRSRIKGKILVVTGGFHTVVLPTLVQQPQPPDRQPIKAEESKTVLMRYSFEQLDALNGYAAGMPTPEYYQRIWEAVQNKKEIAEHPFLTVAHECLVETGIQTRSHPHMNGISTADAIAALEQSQRLAQFRGHPAPLREDLLDGVRSCFVKGAMDADGLQVMEFVTRLLRGDRIGDLPADVGVPPIVEDFRQQAMRFRLHIQSSVTKSVTLDLYRKVNHRRISRFLHTLSFLNVPFARVLSGPDFVKGQGLDRIQEIWEYRWVPLVESALIERSLYGSTLEEAVLHQLEVTIVQLEEEGRGRSATAAVSMLIQACQMGLQTYAPRILALIAEQINEDADFNSLIHAMNQLVLLWQSKEPLEAQKLETIPTLIVLIYQRACFLVPQAAHCQPEAAPAILNSFCTMRELLQTQPHLDSELFLSGLVNLLEQPEGNPVIVGGATGVLYSLGLLHRDRVVALAIGYLNGAERVAGALFMRGLLRTCREMAWTVSELLAAIDEQLAVWDEEDFLRILPDLRLAFADLTPRETDKIAAAVARLSGENDLGDLTHHQLTEKDLQLGLLLNQQLVKGLEADGLDQWFTIAVGEV
jgi:hypothetical protein